MVESGVCGDEAPPAELGGKVTSDSCELDGVNAFLGGVMGGLQCKQGALEEVRRRRRRVHTSRGDAGMCGARGEARSTATCKLATTDAGPCGTSASNTQVCPRRHPLCALSLARTFAFSGRSLASSRWGDAFLCRVLCARPCAWASKRPMDRPVKTGVQ